jgi:hypothetical protein
LDLTGLYQADETEWLNRTAELIKLGKYDEIDYANLTEFLESMAERDRREVESRLVKLIQHVLKWERQPKRRGGSWRRTILEQQRALKRLVRGGSLRRHAEQVLPESYADGVAQAVAETGLPPERFPTDCPWSLDDLLKYSPP